MDIQPVTLEGHRVRLEPLSLDRHFEGLLAIAVEPDLWKFTMNKVESAADLKRYLDTALREQAQGTALPFATMDVATGGVVGCTRFGNISPPNRRVEIGWTWVARPYHRSYVNTEAKYLMLRHAFETWGCVRVELKTGSLNVRSQNAMLRIGAKREGTLRKHGIAENGFIRDTVYFSILDDEWPEVKRGLEAMMSRQPA
jgi:RimJ/RimL family protein N-acetyltransferase